MLRNKKAIKLKAMLFSSILSGILIGTSYIPFPPWATLFAFVPIWHFWIKIHNDTSTLKPLKKILLSGWLTQGLFTFIGFNWVAHTVQEFGHFPWPLAIVTLILFCCIANLYLPLTGLIWWLLQKKIRLNPKAQLVSLALLTALIKMVMPNLFPWNYGYTWYWVKAPIAQTAELIGFNGISAIMIILNLGFYWAYTQRAWRPLVFSLTIFLGLNIGGYALVQTLPAPDREVTAAITQANIGNLEKQYAEHKNSYREAIFTRYLFLTHKAFRGREPQEIPDFLVWPETAYPYDVDQRMWSQSIDPPPDYPLYAKQLLYLAGELKTHLFVGGYGYAPKDGKVTNTFFVVEQDGRMQPHPYYKTWLLPFGEFMPGAETFPFLKDAVQEVGDFARGLGPQVATVKLKNGDALTVGPQICYEGLYPHFSAELAQQGAKIFVNLTNDSWYGTWQEPYQHLYMTLGRAIEFRLPLVRSTNTGISTVVLATGEILEKSPLNTEWVGFYKIPYNSKPLPTVYQKYPWLMTGLLIFILLLVLMRSFFERSTQSRLE